MVQTELIDSHKLKKRSILGALAFTGRTVFLQAIGLVAVFLLTLFLTPEQYGIFFIVDATVSFLVYFSDVGLAAALIQKKSALTDKDLATTFTIQQILVLILVVIAFIISPYVGKFYHFQTDAVILFQVLVVSFFLSSLKTIPSILLERELEFNKLVIPQILETLVFYSVSVVLAWKGWGVNSFTWAVAARAIVGLLALYILKPWVPKIGLDWQVAKSLVSFGAPFQLNSILALFKDRLLIIFLGRVLSTGQIGLLGWAEKWAMTPIRFFADPVLRVTFPAYSRLQDQPAELKKAIEKSIFFVSLLVFPTVVGLVALAPIFVALIPKYNKWEPALIALSLYGINAIFSSISITLTNTLNATGKVRTTLSLMVMWTVLTWLLTPTLVYLFSYNGVALASALTASSSLVAYYLVNKIVKISLWRQLLPAIVGSGVMGLGLWPIKNNLPVTFWSIVTLILFGVLVYASTILIVAKDRVFLEINLVRKYLRRIN